MKVKGAFVYPLETGEKALILLAESKTDQDKLYHYLTIDAYKFKREIAEEEPNIGWISAGYKNEHNEITWNQEYIPVPKWYDLN
ncbi:hypothetical protein ASE74_22705 [Pedobacter sp. Leaf216]|uniref:hypothetical protein n=1 Tax=Pedobacter sp. Leaf216 TaxID=1735684 RepID=UPI0006F6D80A|nr:hypothetical protein [Pedobacter sp. Leaf216]KQM72684.1 hypothetical protein ASE74_22705 [Pedobacter sp. Leaf216]